MAGINDLKNAFAHYVQCEQRMAIMDIGKTRVVIKGKPKPGKTPKFSIVVSSLPLNLELIVGIATDILMIAKPLLSLKRNSRGHMIFSHAVMAGRMNIFIDEDYPKEDHQVKVPLNKFIEQDDKTCLQRLLTILKEPVEKSLLAKERQLLRISSLEKVIYGGLTYTFKGSMDADSIVVYMNPTLFRSMVTVPGVMMSRIQPLADDLFHAWMQVAVPKVAHTLTVPQAADLAFAGALYGKKTGKMPSMQDMMTRFVGKKGRTVVLLEEYGITALGRVERIFMNKPASTKVTVVFSYDVGKAHVDIQAGTEQTGFAYAPDMVEGMGQCVMETPLFRTGHLLAED